jgi:hypothetical protein
MIVVARQANLFQIVLAGGSRRRFTHLLNCRQQQTDQDGNDGNDDQELDERETSLRAKTLVRHDAPPQKACVGEKTTAAVLRVGLCVGRKRAPAESAKRPQFGAMERTIKKDSLNAGLPAAAKTEPYAHHCEIVI